MTHKYLGTLRRAKSGRWLSRRTVL